MEFRSRARRLPWRRVEGALAYAAVARTSSRPSRIFGGNGGEDDTGVIRSAQSIRRSEARALGVCDQAHGMASEQLHEAANFGPRRRTRRTREGEEDVDPYEEGRLVPAGKEGSAAACIAGFDAVVQPNRRVMEGEPVRGGQRAPEAVLACMTLLEGEAHAGADRVRGRVAEDKQDRRASIMLAWQEALRAVDDRLSVT